MYSAFALLPLLLWLALLGFGIYFMINILRFMRTKNEHDALLIQKVDELAAKLDQIERKD
ncbi:hypothetical protein P4475_06165 [Halalkalibacterium halodurans]|jgi:hypothetical protein|uniref:BH3694 protein n=2 Tax=Halalkalibacterium halodurans TaxID=86665 RepID=Q9K6N4_HALH5|nr:hypothetical protein [Halalkalibacterium halodurans]MED3646404.1 hypothetical protein [Halalkalibacterium halodurans]MED4122986.1 hypothetical protein [Halalkalibacterium halodurans]MED4172980.1 hypothetical protein [Halalkalibacterium halodurans]TES56810.1 hypothetical protein E2L07_03945 [Halalkalibacterium halodurans]TPE67865.1 hypothetical protein AMD02_016600 [Halalkalibacterium halodurans]